LQLLSKKGDQDAIRKLAILEDDEFYALRKKALGGDKKAIDELTKLEEKYKTDAAKGDLNARRRLNILTDDHFDQNVKLGEDGDKDAVRKLKDIHTNLKQRAADGDKEAERRLTKVDEILKKHSNLANSDEISDVQSDLSKMMVKSTALQNFGKNKADLVEVPPTAESRRFNECDVIGNLERDDKGNVVTQ